MAIKVPQRQLSPLRVCALSIMFARMMCLVLCVPVLIGTHCSALMFCSHLAGSCADMSNYDIYMSSTYTRQMSSCSQLKAYVGCNSDVKGMCCKTCSNTGTGQHADEHPSSASSPLPLPLPLNLPLNLRLPPPLRESDPACRARTRPPSAPCCNCSSQARFWRGWS